MIKWCEVYAMSDADKACSKDLLSMTMEELKEFVVSIGEPAFRAGQIRDWLYRGYSYSEMTNLSKQLRTKLEEQTIDRLPKVHRKLVSQIDGTVKYLYKLHDGETVESVFMRYKHGNTMCISTQVGCRMG